MCNTSSFHHKMRHGTVLTRWEPKDEKQELSKDFGLYVLSKVSEVCKKLILLSDHLETGGFIVISVSFYRKYYILVTYPVPFPHSFVGWAQVCVCVFTLDESPGIHWGSLWFCFIYFFILFFRNPCFLIIIPRDLYSVPWLGCTAAAQPWSLGQELIWMQNLRLHPRPPESESAF